MGEIIRSENSKRDKARKAKTTKQDKQSCGNVHTESNKNQ